jgi:transcriptional regulator with XRE-family HTH domain
MLRRHMEQPQPYTAMKEYVGARAMTSLGERLRTRRWDELRLFQRDVAAAAGLSPGHLSEIERDGRPTTEPALRRLAAILELDPEEVLAQAEREGRLSRRLSSRGRRDTEPSGPPPAPVPPSPPRPRPAHAWLTTQEAATVLGTTTPVVRGMIRSGVLRPAQRRRIGRGPARWIVSADAVAAYRLPREGRAMARGPKPIPPGYLSMEAFADAVGLSYGALHRRLEAGVIASVRIGNRRLIPEGELTRFTDGRTE